MPGNPRRELRHRLTAIAGAQSGYFSAARLGLSLIHI